MKNETLQKVHEQEEALERGTFHINHHFSFPSNELILLFGFEMLQLYLEKQKLSQERRAFELQQEVFSKQQQLDKEVILTIFFNFLFVVSLLQLFFVIV